MRSHDSIRHSLAAALASKPSPSTADSLALTMLSGENDRLALALELWSRALHDDELARANAPTQALAALLVEDALHSKCAWRTPANHWAAITGLSTYPYGAANERLAGYPEHLCERALLAAVHDALACRERPLSADQARALCDEQLRRYLVALATDTEQSAPERTLKAALTHPHYTALRGELAQAGTSFAAAALALGRETVHELHHRLMFCSLSSAAAPAGDSPFSREQVRCQHAVHARHITALSAALRAAAGVGTST